VSKPRRLAKPNHPHTGPIVGCLYDYLGPVFGKNWKIAAAIAAAESSKDPNAKSSNPGGGENRGLFQIQTLTADGAGFDPNRLFDPTYNARAAHTISKGGTDWHKWATAYGNPDDPSTYMSKDAPFRKFLDGKETKLPDADSAGPFGIPISDSPANPASGAVDSVKDAITSLTSTETLTRIGKFVLGGLLVLLGLSLFANTFSGGKVGKIAKTIPLAL
jgi:hypothetical protein